MIFIAGTVKRMAEKYIKLEDAIAVLCKETCHPGPLCPDNYCVEMREKFRRLYNREIETVEIPRWIPCSEYIRRDKAVETVNTMYERCDTGSMEDFRDLMIEALSALCPEDVQQVRHGHWLDRNNGKWNTIPVLQCSVCGDYDTRYSETDDYCPNCGARMDGEQYE